MSAAVCSQSYTVVDSNAYTPAVAGATEDGCLAPAQRRNAAIGLKSLVSCAFLLTAVTLLPIYAHCLNLKVSNETAFIHVPVNWSCTRSPTGPNTYILGMQGTHFLLKSEKVSQDINLTT